MANRRLSPHIHKEVTLSGLRPILESHFKQGGRVCFDISDDPSVHRWGRMYRREHLDEVWQRLRNKPTPYLVRFCDDILVVPSSITDTLYTVVPGNDTVRVDVSRTKSARDIWQPVKRLFGRLSSKFLGLDQCHPTLLGFAWIIVRDLFSLLVQQFEQPRHK